MQEKMLPILVSTNQLKALCQATYRAKKSDHIAATYRAEKASELHPSGMEQ